MNTRAAVIATTTGAAHQPGGAPARRDNSARPVPSQGSARTGGRAGVSQPCRQQIPSRRVIRDTSLLELPPASAGGVFPAGVKECLTVEFESSPGDDTTLPCRRAGIAGGGIRVLMLTDGIRATCQPGDETPRQQHPKAKEPFAILSCQGVPVTGGSSRRPVSRVTGPSCSGETAAEATSRSGWKPRTEPTGVSGWLPLSGGARALMCVVGSAHRQRFRAHHPSAARAFSRPATAKASSKARLRPRLKRPATLQSLRYAAGPSLWPAFDLSGREA